MMNKVLVELIVPASEKSFDVFIPLGSRMSEIKNLMTGVVSELSEGKFKADATSILCDSDSGIVFDINILVADLGIKNGSRLMLL